MKALALGLILIAEFALASGFESRVTNLTSQLTSVVLPLLGVLGILIAVGMAMTGNGQAKERIIAVIGCSMAGFLAPYIIRWAQSAVGN